MSDAAPTSPIPDLPGLDFSHVALLRNLAARLEAIGGPMAEVALNRLATSTEDHIKTVEIVIELIESIENAAPVQ